MNDFFKYTTVFFFAGTVIFAILYFTKPERVCPECPPQPEIISSHFEGKKDTATSIVGDTSKIHNSKTSKVANPETSKVLPPNDSNLSKVGQSEFRPTADSAIISITDSICDETVHIGLKDNRITGYRSDRKYHLPISADTVTVTKFVPVPVHKNTFVLGSFLSKFSSGVLFGYRSDRVQGSIAYDFYNKQPEAVLTYDLK